MDKIPLYFSIIFFFVCVVYIIFGLYIIYINPKASINRVFFGVCITLSIWAFGFSIAISAPDIEACLFWRRISALGWGPFYSVLLHFILLLTEKNDILRKRWTYLLLYLPSVFVVYVFALSSNLSMLQYSLVKTSFGWTNIAVNNAWDWFFNIYYTGFTIYGLGLIWYWGRNTFAEHIKKQANLIFSSFIITFLLGTATDIVSNAYFSVTIPQMAPIIIIVPIYAVMYSIKCYRLMDIKPINQDEIILNEFTRVKIYDYLSLVFVAGGFLNFISHYLFNKNIDLKSVLYFSASILIIGLIIKIIQLLNIEENYKDIINITTVSLVIPIITLKYINSASITVWAFPFILLIISLVFNKRIVLLALTISILLTQVLVWFILPQAIVEVDRVDHIARIGLFSIAIILAFHVNRVYISRLKENADQIRVQKLISDISSDFVAVNQFNLDEKTNYMLKQSGEFFQVDQAYVFLFDLEQNTMAYTHEWCNEGIKPKIGTARNIHLNVFPWLMNQIVSNEVVHISDVARLPDEAVEEKQRLTRLSIKSLILMPIASKGKVLGFLGYNLVNVIKKWRDDHIDLLKIISNIFADALAKVDAEKAINYMAYYDQLTKLPNRILFKDRVNQAIYLANRTEKMIGVFFLDLDSFKTVNDTMGHEWGDELLKKVAQKLSQSVRKSDTVSRFGGDEFLVMANNISQWKDIVKFADTIMGLFKQPFVVREQELFITASAGIAVFPIDGTDTDTLIKHADNAMYKAKDNGKNQYVLCSPDMKDEVQKKMKLTNSLYRALERNELLLYYQPQICLKSNRIVGLEALLRWNHPELGMISPGVFIPLAEQTGLINPIGEWVLKTACIKNKAWQDMGFPHLRMAVNVSVNQLRNPNLVNQIRDVLEETELNPGYLELEITENFAIKEANYIIGVLNDLKKLGVTISIDDFGMEYSSLSRLKSLPIDRIKIDMQFVHGIDGSEKDKAITGVIINLAKNLDLRVIAEGVETEQQIEFLSHRMCDEVQGFYYYRPMPADDIELVLRDSKN